MMQRKQRPLPTGGRGQRKMQLFTENYAIGAKLKSLRLQVLQNLPIHTLSNWFFACSIMPGSSVRMPASKFRFLICFHSNTGSNKVCATYIYFFPVKHKHLKMNTRTKHSCGVGDVGEHKVYICLISR